jgi:hypothetical protein
VVKGFNVPLNQREIFAVVFGVTAGAFLAGAGGNVVGSMQTFVRSKSVRNFIVAVETLQGRLPAKFVTTGAIGGSIERLVRPR